MIEYRDGTFGEIKDLHEVLKDAATIPPEMMRAIHIGTPTELELRMTMEQRLSALEERIKDTVVEEIHSRRLSVLVRASLAEIERFGGEESGDQV